MELIQNFMWFLKFSLKVPVFYKSQSKLKIFSTTSDRMSYLLSSYQTELDWPSCQLKSTQLVITRIFPLLTLMVNGMKGPKESQKCKSFKKHDSCKTGAVNM